MLIVLLGFSEYRERAGDFMEGHNAWIRRGFDDGVFLLIGKLQPDLGGGTWPITRRCRIFEAG